jgi:hypothetical protein|tara:strand:+ start:264 stop:914 length:651 start_codon:yes stop_codon:yes gene_type:complete
MEKSESIVKLSKALVKMQSEMGAASKSSDNPYFKSKYADLASVKEATRLPLLNNGLTITQFVGEYVAGVMSLETIILHESGEYMSRVASIPIAKADCHAATAGVTYLRRTSIAAVCNLMQEDDDGNAAADPKKRGKGAHSPIQDSLKELSTSELAKANSVSILMTKAHRDGNVEEARRLFYDNGLINEVKSGIWELLQSNSKCRSAVSALQTTRRI